MKITRDNTEILSVHLSASKVLISYAVEEGEVLTNHKVEQVLRQKPMHADFRRAIENMDIHLHRVFMFNDDLIDKISASGIDIKLHNGKYFSRISGKIGLNSGNLASLKTDFIPYETKDNPYEYSEIDDIASDTDLVREEAFRYLFENKTGQLSLFNEEQNIEDVPQEEGSVDEKDTPEEDQSELF